MKKDIPDTYNKPKQPYKEQSKLQVNEGTPSHKKPQQEASRDVKTTPKSRG